jgi:translation initiation factor IF-2
VFDWGGKHQCQTISAKTGSGIDELLEKVLLEADILDLKANKDRLASGDIIESKLDKGLGPIATILVNRGTLRRGDMFICGTQYNKVRGLLNERNKSVKKALPSDPVQVLGFTEVPNAGESFIIMDNEKEAKKITAERSRLKREAEQRRYRKITLDQIGQQISEGRLEELNIIIKGDVDGSIEAVSDALMSLSNNEVSVKIVHRSVGMITENDLGLANTSGAIIIAFNVTASNEAKALSNEYKVEIRNYSIIYEAVNEIKLALEGLLKPTTVEAVLGIAEVRDTFKVPKLGMIAGCMVKEGKVIRNSLLRLIRDGEIIHEGKITSLTSSLNLFNEVIFPS